MRQLGLFSFFWLPHTTKSPEWSGTWKRMHLFLRWVFSFPLWLNICKAWMRILLLALCALEVVSLPSYEVAHWTTPMARRDKTCAIGSGELQQGGALDSDLATAASSRKQSTASFPRLFGCLRLCAGALSPRRVAAPAGSLNSVMPSCCIVKTVDCCSPKRATREWSYLQGERMDWRALKRKHLHTIGCMDIRYMDGGQSGEKIGCKSWLCACF